MKASVVGQRQSVKGLHVASIRANGHGHRAIGVQSQVAVQIIPDSVLTHITVHRLAFQMHGLVNAHDAVGKQRGPDLVATAFKAQRGAARGCEQNRVGSPVIRMILQEEGHVHDVRALALEDDTQLCRNFPVFTEARVFSIEKMNRAHAENIPGASCFDLANRRVSSVAAIGQIDDGDFGSGCYVTGDGPATPEHFVVHVGREHDDFALVRLTNRHGEVKNGCALNPSAQARCLAPQSSPHALIIAQT